MKIRREQDREETIIYRQMTVHAKGIGEFFFDNVGALYNVLTCLQVGGYFGEFTHPVDKGLANDLARLGVMAEKEEHPGFYVLANKKKWNELWKATEQILLEEE